MRMATSEDLIRTQGLAPQALLAFASQHYRRPADVLGDPVLDRPGKRAALAAWASDASAVRDEPTLRWLLGTPSPVPLTEIRAALDALDPWEGEDGYVGV